MLMKRAMAAVQSYDQVQEFAGTAVYKGVLSTGNGTSGKAIGGAGFTPDMVLTLNRNESIGSKHSLAASNLSYYDRINTGAGNGLRSGLVLSFDADGITVGADALINKNAVLFAHHFFKRKAGFFDCVQVGNSGATFAKAHSLGVEPEMMILTPDGTGKITFYFKSLGAAKGVRITAGNEAAIPVGTWANTAPTATEFTVGYDGSDGTTFVAMNAYLFASYRGVSKVFSYTGNGVSQNIDCDFDSPARFVMLRRTDVGADWYFHDTARGLIDGFDATLTQGSHVEGNFPSLDSIDPYTWGFTVIQNATTNMNVAGATYVGLAIA